MFSCCIKCLNVSAVACLLKTKLSTITNGFFFLIKVIDMCSVACCSLTRSGLGSTENIFPRLILFL